MNKHRVPSAIFFALLGLSLLTFISACSESDNDGGITGTGSPLETYLKNGIANTNQNHFSCQNCLQEPLPANEQDSDSSNGLRSEAFSTTNTQEADIDELDWLKTDGELIYSYNGGSAINLFELPQQSGKQGPLNTIPLELSQNFMRGIYLNQASSTKQLISIAEEYSSPYSDYFWHWHDSKSRLDIFNSSRPRNDILQTSSISIDGQYVSSRMIGTKLYIISQYSAGLDDYVIHPYSDLEVERNIALINQASLDDLLPRITINDTSSLLIQEGDCFIPNSPPKATQPTLTTVTEIDLSNPEGISFDDISTSCLAAPVTTIYASKKSVYMVENQYKDSTDTSYHSSHIYKFDYTENGLEYSASIELDGQIDWNQPFRLSEYQDHLRVVTTDWSAEQNNLHRLHVLAIGETGLSLLTSLPNAQEPSPIGKPGEAIQSVRFDGDRAYIVTYLEIDPFYVIDLSTPDKPSIAGELELPGFSTYLHPFGDELVFGLGLGAEDDEAINNITLALFNISDISEPRLVEEIVLEGDTSYSPALHSHTALSILPSEDERSWRLGFAASIYTSWQWQSDAYYLYDIYSDAHEQGEGLSFAGRILGSDVTSGSAASYPYSSYDRGVISDTQVHYSHNGALLSEDWDALSEAE